MSSRIILVVGDKFASYAQGKDAITVSQLRGLLSLPPQLLPDQGRTVLVPGQGMGQACIQSLLIDAEHSPNREHFDFGLWERLPSPAPTSMTHKYRPENTLISTPRRISEDCYELSLLIDENCELMSDHQSGQHVQGMLLIEAVRQSTMAITESFYITDPSIEYAFVLNDMSVQYNNFSFPVAATIVCRFVDKKVDNPRRLSFSIEAEVRQCDTCVSSLTFSIAAMERHRIYKREAMQANKTQKRFLAELGGELEQPAATPQSAHSK